jgi:Protein of unknown function (DUF4058)
MAIHTLKNQYAGVNPHLNSLLQTPGNLAESRVSLWPTFHSSHLVDLANILNDVLPSSYIARAEHSLQVKADYLVGVPRMHGPEPDVTIFGQSSGTVSGESVSAVAEPRVLLLEKSLDIDEDFVKAVVIYHADDDSMLGKVVTRIELLSPSNMPGGAGYRAYRDNRNQALFSGIPLIEMHYLHELPYPLMDVPAYPTDKESRPYHIFVSDPRPSVKEGHLYDYGFDVDMSFPVVDIPLLNDEKVSFDFGAAYQHTFRRGRWGTWQNLVDYTQLPVRFHSYSSADQERIRRRMTAIAESHASGTDPEQ